MTSKNHHTSEPKPEEGTPVPETQAQAEAPSPETGAATSDPRDQEIAALKDRQLRLQADFDNFRKRTLRDREDMARRAAERILKELLPVADHFELGLQAARKHHVKHAVLDGLDGVLKQLQSVLEKSGVVPIETKGQTFDPHNHECVAQIPSEEHPENMIIEETRKGYRLGTFVLRASQVIVSTGPAAGSVPPVKTPTENDAK
jgi:molecular chaperone GrpE